MIGTNPVFSGDSIPTVVEDESDPRLQTFAKSARATGWFCLDTEFLRVETYRPKLCLVQLATPDIAIAVDALQPRNLTAVLALLADPHIEKILHSGSQDQEVLAPLLPAGRLRPVLDTQIAATFLGAGYQISYARLVEHRLGITLDKSQSRTDWSRRPLSTAQLDYALADVTHLVDLAPGLKRDLEASGHARWHDQEVERIYVNALTGEDPGQLWKRVSGQQAVHGRARAILREIVVWREQIAQRRDRPRKWILEDDEAVRLARLARNIDIRSAPHLPAIRAGRAGRWHAAEANALMDAIERGHACPGSEIPEAPSRRKPTPLRANLIEATLDRLARRARECGIAPEFIGNKQDLNNWLDHVNASRFDHGWIAEFGAQELQELRSQLDTVENPRGPSVSKKPAP